MPPFRRLPFKTGFARVVFPLLELLSLGALIDSSELTVFAVLEPVTLEPGCHDQVLPLELHFVGLFQLHRRPRFELDLSHETRTGARGVSLRSWLITQTPSRALLASCASDGTAEAAHRTTTYSLWSPPQC